MRILVGFQRRGIFLPLEMGFDPAFAKYSLGTVLQFLLVEHLFANNPPQVLDLGGYGTWKDVLSTTSYLQSRIMLFRPGAYNLDLYKQVTRRVKPSPSSLPISWIVYNGNPNSKRLSAAGGPSHPATNID